MNNYVWAHESFDIYDGVVWFVPYYIDLLCGYSLIKKKIVSVVNLPELYSDEDRYLNVKAVDGNLIIIPSYSEYIHIYNIKTQKFYSHKVSKGLSAKYFQCYNEDGVIYVLPYTSKDMIKIELRKDDIPNFEEVPFSYKNCVSCVLTHEGVYSVNRSDGILFRSKGGAEEEYHEKGTILTDLAYLDDKYLVVADASGRICKFNKNLHEIEYWFDVGSEVHSLALCNERLMIFPERENDFFWVFDLNNYELLKKFVDVKTEYKHGIFNSFSKAIVDGDFVYVMSPYHEMLIEVNASDLHINKHYIKIPNINDEQKMIIVDAESKRGYVKENDAIGVDLAFFLSLLCNDQDKLERG